jgi:type IV secretion system protein VirB5
MANRFLLWGFVVLFAADASQALVPVIDMKAIIGTMRNIEAIKDMKNAAHGDFERLRGEFNALNPLGFKTDDLASRDWSANSWESALSGGGKSAIAEKINDFKIKNEDIYQFSSSTQQKEEVEKTLKTSAVLDAETTQEYDRLGLYSKKINELSNVIRTSASTKSALDINNKLLVELAYLSIEGLRMQVMSNQASSQRLHHELKIAAATDQFLGTAGGDQ